jgi:hypothetical protein
LRIRHGINTSATQAALDVFVLMSILAVFSVAGARDERVAS